MSTKTAISRALSVLIIMGWCATGAEAQSSVGSGPLTNTLTDTEPVSGVISLGRLKVAPGITVSQLGWDDNIFDEPESESPKEDYLIEMKPDLSLFTALRFVRLSAYLGSNMSYFQTYDSENDVGYDGRARVDVLLSRMRPFFGYGETKTQTRSSGEINGRVERTDQEASGGLAFDISPHAVIYGAAYQSRAEYADHEQEGINLANSLTRDGYHYEGGLRTDLTPLLSMQLIGGYHEDRFPADATRNATGKSFTGTFRVAPDAVFTGVVSVSYTDMEYVDPEVKPFQGMTGNVSITYPFLEIGRFSLTLRRGVEYSFDANEAYYVENSAAVTYTHRLFGQVDLQGKGNWSAFDYSARETEPAHVDRLDSAGGSLGYNLRNRTRIALNYEYTRKRSPAFADRNYQRRRIFVSWMFAF